MTLLSLDGVVLPGGTSVSLEVAAGEAIGIVGETGPVGEDLVSLLLGQSRPPGKTVFDGRNLSRAGRREIQNIRRRLGILRPVSEAPLNPRRSIRAAVQEPLDVLLPGLKSAERDERVEAALAASGAEAAWLAERPVGLPRGAVQAVALARALICAPDLLLAVEPFLGLELEDSARLANRFLALRQNGGPAIVLVSRCPEFALHVCDTIVVLHRGQCVETGTATDIRVLPGHAYTQQLVNAIPEPTGGAFDLRVAARPR
ncbi:MAG: ATP-binding cassette domain-containing protein [Pseudomonadota bacterium]